MNTTNIVFAIAGGAVILGTTGGIITHFSKPGGTGAKVGAFLSTLGTDLVSFVKVIGGVNPPSGGAS